MKTSRAKCKRGTVRVERIPLLNPEAATLLKKKRPKLTIFKKVLELKMCSDRHGETMLKKARVKNGRPTMGPYFAHRALVAPQMMPPPPTAPMTPQRTLPMSRPVPPPMPRPMPPSPSLTRRTMAMRSGVPTAPMPPPPPSPTAPMPPPRSRRQASMDPVEALEVARPSLRSHKAMQGLSGGCGMNGLGCMCSDGSLSCSCCG